MRVATFPAGAEVYRDELLLGTTPCVVRLPPGAAHIELRRPGYRTVERDIEARDGGYLAVGLTVQSPPKGKRGKALTRSGTIDPFKK
jgi:hypothetical protein